MADVLSALWARAFHSVPAMEANQAMAVLRDERGQGAPALSYEAVVPAGAGVEHLQTQVVPRLVYFLDCRGARLPNAPGVFLSLFHGDRLYFLEVHDFFEVFTTAAGVELPELIRRHGAASAES